MLFGFPPFYNDIECCDNCSIYIKKVTEENFIPKHPEVHKYSSQTNEIINKVLVRDSRKRISIQDCLDIVND